ncbi:hypothetical protein BGW38_005294, partial [Lunasporangiospora selenospora]
QEGSQKNPGQALQWYTKAAYNGENDALFRAAYCYENGIGTVPNLKGAEDWYLAAANKGHLEAQFCLAELYTRGGPSVQKNLKAAFDLYLKAAYSSHTAATRRVGECLMRELYTTGGVASSSASTTGSPGAGEIPVDLEKAFSWWMTAASAVEGSIDIIDKSLAQFKVADCLMKGTGTEANFKSGLQWLLQSAQDGHPEAMHVYARMLNSPPTGSDMAKDTTQAMEWLERAATAGWPEALLSLGNAHQYGMYGKTVDYEQAFYFYEKSAEKSNGKAMATIGNMYSQGQGTSKSPEKAFEWWLKAAQLGIPVAQTEIGYCYRDGWGVNQNLKGAVEWFTAAANNGHADACCALALSYINGRGVPVNMEMAFEWFNKGAELGSGKAMYNLGMMYKKGDFVQKDDKKKFAWYENALRNNYEEASYDLGVCYLNGENGSKDPVKARELFVRAHNNANSAEACINLAAMAVNERNDWQEAFEWQMAAATKGHAIGMRRVAIMYKEGKGVAVNPPQAYAWFLKAAQAGDVPSMSHLTNCYRTGFGTEKSPENATTWEIKAMQGQVVAQGVNFKDSAPQHARSDNSDTVIDTSASELEDDDYDDGEPPHKPDSAPSRWRSWYRSILRLFKELGKFFLILALGTIFVGVVLQYTLPRVDEEHRKDLHFPHSLEDLEALRKILVVYMDKHYYRVVFGFLTIYLYLQTFSVPGSMWLSILGGALFKFWAALIMVSFASAIGATNCYLLSRLFFSKLVKRKFGDRMEKWNTQ